LGRHPERRSQESAWGLGEGSPSPQPPVPLVSLAIAPLARTPELASNDTCGQELSLGFFSEGEDAVAYLEVLERDGSAVLHELSLIINEDDSFTLAGISDLELILIDRHDFAENSLSGVLKTLHFLVSHASNGFGHELVVGVGLTSNRDVIPRFQVFELDFLLSLAVASAFIHHHGLR